MSLDPISAVSDLVKDVVDRVFPDKTQEEKNQLALALAQLQSASAASAAQTDIDKAEAASTNVWVSGWRPGAGWICVAGFAMQYIFSPLATWVSTLIGHPVPFPSLDGQTLMSLLFALLGLSGTHAFMAVQGVEKK